MCNYTSSMAPSPSDRSKCNANKLTTEAGGLRNQVRKVQFLSTFFNSLFSQKVGGHSKLIKIGNGLVGKPLIHREAEMYRMRPQKMSCFMPEFKGS